MKRFKVSWIRSVNQVFEIEVEAEDEDHAEELAVEGEYDDTEPTSEYEVSNWNSIEVEELEQDEPT
jgi:hypothetical protein